MTTTAQKKLFLTFACRDGSHPQEFAWHVRDTELGRLWFSELWQLLPDETRVREQIFWGFPKAPEALFSIIELINDSIKAINDFYKSRYYIHERAFTGMGQDHLNRLHHHFEILMGQSWNKSEFTIGCPPEVVKAVRRLNDYIHLYEQSVKANSRKQEGKNLNRSFQIQMVPYNQKELSLDHLKTFSFEVGFGDLVTNYCQLGKTWLDVYNDKDEHIFLENITPLRFYAATFSCYFFSADKKTSDWMTYNVKDYILELNKKNGWNIDPHDPRQALGHAVYASLPPDSPFLEWPKEKLDEFFETHSNVTKIRLQKGTEEISRTFVDPDSYFS